MLQYAAYHAEALNGRWWGFMHCTWARDSFRVTLIEPSNHMTVRTKDSSCNYFAWGRLAA
jgi:ribosomal protein S18 acetylase RimI-like enzyme